MSPPPDVEYQVLLVFPGFGVEREHAEQIIEEALAYLNTQKDEPGMRFAYNVSARLEVVATVEEAYARLEDDDDDLATMILHDLDDDERRTLTLACAARDVPVCHTIIHEETPEERRRRRRRPRELKVVFRKREPDDEPRAHRIAETTLIAPLDGDPDELGDRVGQLITVLALGVMEHHWRQNPPRFSLPEEPGEERAS
jgi:hypothetical protein